MSSIQSDLSDSDFKLFLRGSSTIELQEILWMLWSKDTNKRDFIKNLNDWAESRKKKCEEDGREELRQGETQQAISDR